MTRKAPMTPKNYIQEFIEVLKIEIEELKQAKDNNIILKNNNNPFIFPNFTMFLRNHMIITTFITNKQTNKRNIQKITRDGTKEKTDLF